jgi:hypothetical protein
MELTLVRKLGLPDNTPLIEALVHREVVAGFGKSDLARKGLREQYAGKPRQQVDLSSDDGSMSPLGPDSVASALRAAIKEKQREAQKQDNAEQPNPEATAGDDAGAK